MVGIGRRPRKRAASTGMIVRLTTIETTSATDSDRLSDWKNWPTTPLHERQRHEDEDRRQCRADDRAADLAAGAIDAPSPVSPPARCRAMFSITTTVSSMISPIATASPPSDIRFSVSPVR